MKRLKLKIAVVGLALVLGTLAMAGSVFATKCGDTDTILIDCGGASPGKDSICAVANMVVRIMTTGVGILAILGVIVVGIQYLTASDNEEKLRKSKRRLLELVIGIVVYVLAGSAIQWLFLPGNNFCGINPGAGGGTGEGGGSSAVIPDLNSGRDPLESHVNEEDGELQNVALGLRRT